MNWDDERAAFELRVSQNFNTVPVQYPGVPLTPPASGSWVRMVLLPGDVKRISLGDNAIFRERGVLAFMIFVPVKDGTRAALELAQELSDIFHEAHFQHNDSGWIRCRVPAVHHVGPSSEGTWYQVNLLTDYERDVVLG